MDLQDKIGAERFLALIAANGTLFELFRLLQRSTPAFARAPAGALEEPRVRALYDRTVEAGRSIGTLHLALRELGRTDGKLREDLQDKIGVERFLALIAANGTLFELFGLLQYSTPAFARALLDALDEPKAQALYDKTVEASVSPDLS